MVGTTDWANESNSQRNMQHTLKDLYNRAAQLRLHKATLTVGSPEWTDVNNRLLSVTCKIASTHKKLEKR